MSPRVDLELIKPVCRKPPSKKMMVSHAEIKPTPRPKKSNKQTSQRILLHMN
jgi:hypothetical protein